MKELDDSAYTYESGSDFVADSASEVSSRTRFSPKSIVRRLLLQVQHGREIAATFTVQSKCDVEVLYHSKNPFYFSMFYIKWCFLYIRVQYVWLRQIFPRMKLLSFANGRIARNNGKIIKSLEYC